MNASMQNQIRPATKQDALSLAKLIDIAGEGIPNWLWSRSAGNGKSPLDIGTERAQRSEGGFSFINASIFGDDKHTKGMLLGYPIHEAPDDDVEGLPAPIAPFVELEKHSVETWYINALAVFAKYRGQGIGSTLMDHAEKLAQEAGLSKMSIQVYGQNTGAVRLYERLGYQLVETAQVRDHPCQPYYTGDVLLLTKHIA